MFAAAGTIAIQGFWIYLAILAAVMIASFVVLDPDLLRNASAGRQGAAALAKDLLPRSVHALDRCRARPWPFPLERRRARLAARHLPVHSRGRLRPAVTRAAVLRDAAQTAGIGQFAVIQSVARSVGIDAKAINLRDAAEIECSVAAFARTPNGGLILTAGATSAVHRDLIISLAARYKLPQTYQERSYVVAGGLVSYGPNFSDQYPRAAAYIDRILKGEKPGDLPVQAPTKYDLVVNLKTAKALGLTVPTTLLASADEVIE